jgi:amidase
MMPPDSWQAVAARKQAQRSAKVPAEWRIPASIRPPADVASVQDFPRDSGFFTEDELRITGATASEVVFRIARAEWTALQVVTAVCKRAAVAQQLLNCLTEVMFDEAVARAKELDAYYLQTGRTVGLLHGLPIR